ncbi:hypothetical protein [Mycobacterium sp. E3198]|uniref:hypothetical protein n=1 Tax=Mycobacterium sp. E3198 TaxID=1834143 RepID=UPI000A7AA096|nr:hypothetical protein [Mycobacterium sp. E3198]
MGIDPSGRFVIAGSDPARVWNTSTGRCVLTIPEFRADRRIARRASTSWSGTT